MRLRDSTLLVTPTDIANHLACRHLTQLDRARAEGRLNVELRQDPRVEALRHRGDAHEKQFVESLAAQGLSLVDLRGEQDAAATLDAMRAGTDAIVQAPLEHDGIYGRADVLLRVPTPSHLGAYSYEPADTKLARDTRAGTILQLCTYALLLEAMQGVLPEHIHVVTPLAREPYRTAHFDAYFRFVRRRLEDDLAAKDVDHAARRTAASVRMAFVARTAVSPEDPRVQGERSALHRASATPRRKVEAPPDRHSANYFFSC